MNHFSLVRKNLLRKKTRTFLLFIAILMAFLIYAVLSSFNQAFNAGVKVAAADRLVVVNKINFTQSLPYAYYNRVRALAGVQNIFYADWFGGYYQEPRNMVITMAVEPVGWFAVFSEVLVNDEQKRTFLNDRTGILIGRMLAKRMNWQVGQQIPINSSIYRQSSNGQPTWKFTIRGIFDANRPEFDTNFAVFHHEYFNEARDMGKDSIGWMVLTTGDPARNENVMHAIDALFANSSFETETTTEQAFNKAFLEQIGSISLIIRSVVAAALLTILMIVGNSMYRAIRERTAEIAVMKTLGFTGKRLFALTLAESCLLTWSAGLLGLGLASILLYTLAPMLASVLPSLKMTTTTLFSSLLLMCALGLFTGFIPAWQALRLNIQQGLLKE